VDRADHHSPEVAFSRWARFAQRVVRTPKDVTHTGGRPAVVLDWPLIHRVCEAGRRRRVTLNGVAELLGKNLESER